VEAELVGVVLVEVPCSAGVGLPDKTGASVVVVTELVGFTSVVDVCVEFPTTGIEVAVTSPISDSIVVLRDPVIASRVNRDEKTSALVLVDPLGWSLIK